MQPILFEFKFIVVQSFWAFTALALFVSTWIFGKLAQRSRLRLQFVLDIGARLLLGGLIFSRIFAIIGDFQFYFSTLNLRSLFRLVSIWDLDLSFWGFVFGLLFVFYNNAKEKREPLSKWSDIFAVALMIGLTIGNFAALLGGYNYGRPTETFLGVTFNSAFIKYTVPIYPTQVFALIYTGLLSLWLVYIFKKFRSKYEGLIFLLAATSFSLLRFIEGFFRGDDVLTFWIFRLPQWLFLAIGLFASYKLYYYQKQNRVPGLRKYEELYSKLLFFKK